MKSKIDLTIERLIRSKYRNIENAKRDRRISALLKDCADILSLSKRDKESLLQLLIS